MCYRYGPIALLKGIQLDPKFIGQKRAASGLTELQGRLHNITRRKCFQIALKKQMLLSTHKNKAGHKSARDQRLASERPESFLSNVNNRFEIELKRKKPYYPQNIIPQR